MKMKFVIKSQKFRFEELKNRKHSDSKACQKTFGSEI